ncbi:MAG: hypothetical protein FD153_1188 [Rhodospirillaceae bacterium]|nr:MAG: hypothetical protein FD153_1188 [Rhodospirillaceae bacterium]
MVRQGFSVLRFNFRGVGRSQGLFDNGRGELADAAAAFDWLQDVNAGATVCWVVGYSLGAWVSMQLLMRCPEAAAFISVSLPACIVPLPGLIILAQEVRAYTHERKAQGPRIAARRRLGEVTIKAQRYSLERTEPPRRGKNHQRDEASFPGLATNCKELPQQGCSATLLQAAIGLWPMRTEGTIKDGDRARQRPL